MVQYQLNNMPAIYRSQDEAIIGGVFAGLAHKWGLNKNGLRVVFLGSLIIVDMFLTFYMLTIFILLMYFALCLVAPKIPTAIPPEDIATNLIKEAYAKKDYVLALHYAQSFIQNHPNSPKIMDFKHIADELRKKI